jgi:hypothetical protein
VGAQWGKSEFKLPKAFMIYGNWGNKIEKESTSGS